MLILLPPSETKRPGGSSRALDLDALAMSELEPQRRAVVEALVQLSTDAEAAARVLKLGARQLADVEANRRLLTSPTRPAIERYTGVLYDALSVSTLDPASRRWLGGHVMIHSAPFGPVGALDAIPTYRLGAGISLPGMPTLRRLWADAVTRSLARAAPPFVLDLRSEAHVALGPVPAEVPSAYVRVVSEGKDGAVRALNHFNKHAKGELVRRLAQERPRVRSARSLLAWAHAAGVALRPVEGSTTWMLTIAAP
jgi:cytoplasmic iron level regulating protein YaaA (DUF328/UPF0246 family)